MYIYDCFYDFFIAVILLFYDIKYLNSIKSRLFNQNSGMVLQLTLFSNLNINIFTRCQVSIFTNDEVKGGLINPLQGLIRWLRMKRLIGLNKKNIYQVRGQFRGINSWRCNKATIFQRFNN